MGRRDLCARHPWVRWLGAFAVWVLPAVAQAQTETTEYYAADALGSIRVVFDGAGSVVARADYLPFGEALSASAGLPAERFTGQARDAEAGLDYFNARMLQARTARFLSFDPAPGSTSRPQSWNRYTYALANPTRYTDPSGAESVTTSCFAVSGAYWCPGSFVIPEHNYQLDPSAVDSRFDANAAGYQGGEVAFGEAQYANRVDSEWDQGREAQYYRESAVTQFKVTVEGRLPKREASDVELNRLAMGIARRTAAVADGTLFGAWYAASIGGGAAGAFVALGGLESASAALFSRGGMLNANDFIRLGWGWEPGMSTLRIGGVGGMAQTGREVFRIGIGAAGSILHSHIRLWPPPGY